MSNIIRRLKNFSHWDGTLHRFKLHPLARWIGGSTLILFLCSSLRHFLIQSTAFDLAIFDQGTYLISQGLPPVSSFIGFHLLGDHAAFIFYPLALLYKIYPDVHWLFLVQALGLAMGALPLWAVARQMGMTDAWATTLGAVYLLYPLVFNVNLFDFHPEVLAPGLFLGAVWAARSHRIVWFAVAVVLILSLKAVLSLTVAAFGVWLLMVEKRRICGAIALLAGIAWFLLTVQWFIPLMSGAPPAAVGRYAGFGNAPWEIAQNLILKPGLLVSHLFTWENLAYVTLLGAPVVWGLSFRHLGNLLPAAPAILLNLLSADDLQKDLIHQYSVPVVPFLMLTVIATQAAGDGWWRHRRAVMLWSLVAFMALAKFGYFGSRYLTNLDTWQANREAIAQIQPQGGVLTSHRLAPQVSHRPIVRLLNQRAIKSGTIAIPPDITYVLLDLHHPPAPTAAIARTLLKQLQQNPRFRLDYSRDQVYLFVAVDSPPTLLQ